MHDYQARLAAIQTHLANGGTVRVSTYTQATVYDKRHVGMFSANTSGLYVQRGKRKDCLNFTTIRFSK